MNVDVLNNGTETETFLVAVYYDNSTIKTLEVAHLAPVDQAPNNIGNVSLLWDTRGVSDGKYNVTVEAILGADEDLSNNKATDSVTLKPRPDVAIANLTVSSTRVLTDDQLNVTVVVKNEGKTYETPIIRVEFKNATSPSFINNAQPVDPVPLEPGAEGTWTLSWDVSKDVPPGNYTLSAEAELANDDDEDNRLVYGEITVGASDISISASPETITLGSRTTVSGSITPVRPNVTVAMHYRIIGNDTWRILENVTTTDGNGTYSYDWRPEATGTYEVMTSWKGDNNTLPGKSETLTIIVNPAIPILLYGFVAGAVAAIIIAVAIYFFKIRKPKPA